MMIKYIIKIVYFTIFGSDFYKNFELSYIVFLAQNSKKYY